MLRKVCVLAALLLLSQGLGCAMCANPYDYTGPVPADGMGFNDRAGSVLQGGINEGEWNAEMDQDALGDTIVNPGQSAPPQERLQGEPVLAPQPDRGYGPQTRMAPPAQGRPVVQRAGMYPPAT